MAEIGPDTTVQMESGEVIGLFEFVARTMESMVAKEMTDEFAEAVIGNIEHGADYEAMRPFFLKFLPHTEKEYLEELGIGFDQLFRRIHDAAVKEAMRRKSH